MISNESADLLIDIISNENDTLETLSAKFKEECPKSEQYPLLISLSSLILAGILDSTQQTVSAWLLYDFFPHDKIQANPFRDVFQYICQNSNSNNFSQKLCDITASFLTSTEEISNRSAHDIIETNDPNGPEPIMSYQLTSRTSGIIIDKPDPNACQVTEHQLLRELLKDTSIWIDFQVPLIHIPPDLLEVSAEEQQICNIQSFEPTPFLFDEDNLLNRHEATKKLLIEANEHTLFEKEEELVIKELNDFQAPLITKMDVIEKIQQNNSRIGAILFVQNAKIKPELFESLKSCDINQQTYDILMEMVNLLDDPNKYIEDFVMNASSKFNKLKTNQDQYQKKAKLFISLIVSLFNKKVNFTQKTVIELDSLKQNFKHRNVSEVSKLEPIFSSSS